MKPDAKSRIVLVDDHWIFRESLAALINDDPRFEVCAQADNIQDGFHLCVNQRPDIAIVDLTLKGSSGLELIKELKAQEISVPVLVLSMHEESLYAERVLEAGAKGYLTKHENSDTLLAAIVTVLGEIFISARR